MKPNDVIQEPIKKFIALLAKEDYAQAATKIQQYYTESGWNLEQKQCFVEAVLHGYSQHSHTKSFEVKMPGPSIGKYQFWMDLNRESLHSWNKRISVLTDAIRKLQEFLCKDQQQFSKEQEAQKQAKLHRATEEARLLQEKLASLQEKEGMSLMEQLEKNQKTLVELIEEVKVLASTPPQPITYSVMWSSSTEAVAVPVPNALVSEYLMKKRLMPPMSSSPSSSTLPSPKQRRKSYPCYD